MELWDPASSSIARKRLVFRPISQDAFPAKCHTGSVRGANNLDRPAKTCEMESENRRGGGLYRGDQGMPVKTTVVRQLSVTGDSHLFLRASRRSLLRALFLLDFAAG